MATGEREFYDEEPVQANSYTCTITRMTRDGGSGWECRSEGEKDGRNTRGKKTRVPQRERGRWTSGKSRSGGRHTEGAERRTINVRTTTSRWLVGRIVDHHEQNPHRLIPEFEIDEPCLFEDIDTLYFLRNTIKCNRKKFPLRKYSFRIY